MDAASLSRTVSLTAGALLVLAPSLPLAAQAGPGARAELGREVRARSLGIAATGDYSRAAARLLQEIEEVGVSGLERARSLALAGRLYHHAGDLDRARRTMIRAGLVAYHADEPEKAVRLFLDAAEAASQDGKAYLAWRAAERAGFVLRTADLTAPRKIAALARVVYRDQVPYFQVLGPLATQLPDLASH